MTKTVYIVTSYRFGERSDHSYVIGAFDKKAKAIKCAEEHTTYRGGKYLCSVDECTLNHYDNEDDNYTNEIYRTMP